MTRLKAHDHEGLERKAWLYVSNYTGGGFKRKHAILQSIPVSPYQDELPSLSLLGRLGQR